MVIQAIGSMEKNYHHFMAGRPGPLPKRTLKGGQIKGNLNEALFGRLPYGKFAWLTVIVNLHVPG